MRRVIYIYISCRTSQVRVAATRLLVGRKRTNVSAPKPSSQKAPESEQRTVTLKLKQHCRILHLESPRSCPSNTGRNSAWNSASAATCPRRRPLPQALGNAAQGPADRGAAAHHSRWPRPLQRHLRRSGPESDWEGHLFLRLAETAPVDTLGSRERASTAPAVSDCGSSSTHAHTRTHTHAHAHAHAHTQSERAVPRRSSTG